MTPCICCSRSNKNKVCLFDGSGDVCLYFIRFILWHMRICRFISSSCLLLHAHKIKRVETQANGCAVRCETMYEEKNRYFGYIIYLVFLYSQAFVQSRWFIACRYGALKTCNVEYTVVMQNVHLQRDKKKKNQKKSLYF